MLPPPSKSVSASQSGLRPLQSIVHRISPLKDLKPGELLLHELYRSLQGESTYAGLPCVFVRTAVCHQRCRWCDTPHAFNQGAVIPRADVLAKVLSLNTPLVEITGGEPLLQADVLPLMVELCDAGKTVLLETSGSIAVGPVDARVHIIMDLKCPDSGECEQNLWSNLDKLKRSDEVKFVVASRRDWLWASETIKQHKLDDRVTVQVSAAFGEVNLKDLAEWILQSGLNVRLQLQAHKYVWDPKARGV